MGSKERPAFRYEYRGVEISETPEPRIRPGGTGLVRVLSLEQLEPDFGLYLRVAVGESIQRENEETWLVEGKRPFRIRHAPVSWPDAVAGQQAYIVRGGDGMELRLPISSDSGTSRMVVTPVRGGCKFFAKYLIEYSW